MNRSITAILSTAALGGAVFALPAEARQEHGHHSSKHAHGEAGIGKPGEPGKVNRTVRIVMQDNMRFTPQSLIVKRGEVIRFDVVNAGKIRHEMVIGSMEALIEHAKMMQKFPGMEHAEPNQVTLQRGKSGVLVWQFDTAGTVDFACLQPGHFEAGMKGVVKVVRK
ncbi:MAG TPA: cupredoxin family protein [Pseudoduganella sp.]